MVLQSAQGRHSTVSDPVEIMAAFGGFEVAMMVGAMLGAASKRSLIVVDGLPACSALLVASRISPAVLDYCAFSRSHSHPGLNVALGVFEARALLELGLSSLDGTGAVLAWPLLQAAAALLTVMAEGEEPGPTWPTPLIAEIDPIANVRGATVVSVPASAPAGAAQLEPKGALQAHATPVKST
jgi:nicotinate-nucleotide--dimethylbenzimidazole phosphoribosyltransferase